MTGLLLSLSDSLRHRLRARRWTADQAAGRRAEDLAHRFLRRRGFTVVARNFRPASGAGEIDLIAWDAGTLVFVEVKSRATTEFGEPDRAVDAAKRSTLLRAAGAYLRLARLSWDRARFDIVSVVCSQPPAVTHIRDAFRPAHLL
jgi:putative endonuclease